MTGRAVTAPVDDLDGGGAVLEELTPAECLALAKGQAVGRVAVARRGAPPHVVPVDFVVDGTTIVFRTGPGTKLRLVPGRLVSFEVDAVDAARRTGWSVLFQARAYEVPASEVQHLGIAPSAPGDRRHWIRVVPIVTTGRRISRPVATTLDPRGYL